MRRWKDNVDCFQPKQGDIEGLQRGYVGRTEPESRPDDAATAVDQWASHGLEERLQLDNVAIGGFDVVIERQDQQCCCPVTRNSLPLGVCVSRCCHGLMGLTLVYLSEVMEEELSNGGDGRGRLKYKEAVSCPRERSSFSSASTNLSSKQ